MGGIVKSTHHYLDNKLITPGAQKKGRAGVSQKQHVVILDKQDGVCYALEVCGLTFVFICV